MHDLLLRFATWIQNTPFILWITTSDHLFPFVQWTHFTGLSFWVGTNLMCDLSLLGFGKKFQTAAELTDALFAWNWIGLAIAITGGFTLFSSAAVGYIDNPAFRIKIFMILPVALIWHIIVQRKTRVWGRTSETPAIAKLAGGIEILMWLSVMIAAVWIPNY
jgi:hypothetical protein